MKSSLGMLSNGDGSSPCDCAGWEHAPAGATNGPVCHLPKGAFKSNANYLVRSAQEFPDDKYTVKLGTQRETRTSSPLPRRRGLIFTALRST